jgi:hypothetical protein
MSIFGIAKKGFGMLAKKSKTIKSIKPAKNLTERRKTFETMTGAVDKQYKKSGLGITDKGKKIKRDAALEGSKIHDKYEKLQKILDKRK